MLTASALLIAFAAAAFAQESGVQYDDDSPAGKEYALPLAEARGVGGSEPPSAPGAADGDARFGAGISAREGGGPSADGPDPAAGATSGEDAGTQGADPGTRVPAASPSAGSLREELVSDNADDWRLGLLVAGGAALSALALGFGLRRRA